MLTSRLMILLILAILTTTQAATGSPESESLVEIYFGEIHTDADTSGSGFLVGIPRPISQPHNQLFWDVEGEDITVEAWTRYYQDVAGVSTQAPDRADERDLTGYGPASGSVVTHSDDADLAVVPKANGDRMTVSTSFPTNQFETRINYLYRNDFFLPGEISEFHDFDPPDNPAWYYTGDQKENFQYSGTSDDGWVTVQGNFTTTFLYGSFDIHNGTHTERIEAKRQHLGGTPPVYEEYSITRAFIHATNATANIQPGGRITQINLADFDIPDSSTLRFTEATGTWSHKDQEKSFSNANLQITGEGLELLAQPYSQNDDLLKKGEIKGSIKEFIINGRPIEPKPQSTTTNETPRITPLVLLIGAVIATLVSLFYPFYRTLRRRQSIPFAQRASALYDERYYEAAAYWARKAVKCDPHSKEAAAILTLIALQTGNVDEAIACLERTSDEDHPLIQLLLAVTLRRSGEKNRPVG